MMKANELMYTYRLNRLIQFCMVCLCVALLISCGAGEGGPAARPKINEPSVVGNRPGTPFLFAIPTTGTRPVTWSAKGLPEGLVLDPETGIISGAVEREGVYVVDLKAQNKSGRSEKTLTIKIGELLALTPPMGWNSWNTFAGELTDSVVRQIADAMVATGMRDLGYQYVNIDDFWQLAERDENGNIRINRDKFPGGIKAVADYVHSKGLKLGIYSDAADRTCGGVAGSYQHEDRDARDFAAWGVDLLKYDYCGAPAAKDSAIVRYSRMAKALRSVPRSIVFSVCEWGGNDRQPWTWADSIGGNYWRTTWDIRNTWKDGFSPEHAGIMDILDVNARLSKYAGPGHWNDPDMLVVGIYDRPGAVVNYNGIRVCSDEEYRTHMSMWCLMAAPLLCGNDIRNMNNSTREILLNPEIIAIDQDPLGKQAVRVRDDGDIEVYLKPLTNETFALGLLNRSGSSKKITATWEELKISGLWKVRDIWEHRIVGSFKNEFQTEVPAHGCSVVKLYK